MKTSKRIVTQILAFVICISLCVTTVSANEWYNDVAYVYTQYELPQYLASFAFDGLGAYLGSAIGTVLLPGIGTVSGAALGTFLGGALNHGFNDLMSWLAEEPSFVPEDEYIGSLDTPTISMSSAGVSIPFVGLDSSRGDYRDYNRALSDGILSYDFNTYSYSFFVLDSSRLDFWYDSVFCITSTFDVSDYCELSVDVSAFNVEAIQVEPSVQLVLYKKGSSGDCYSISGQSVSGAIKSLNHNSVYRLCTLSIPDYKFSLKVSPGSYFFTLAVPVSASSYPGQDDYYNGLPLVSVVLPTLSINTTSHALGPARSTRPTYITNAITNYNSENNEYNYFIGKVDNSNNVTNVFNVNIFDETTNEFRDPYTDKPYQVTNWVYDYAQRLYVLTLADDTLLYNGKPIKNLVIWYADNALYYIGLDDSYTDGSDWVDHIVFTDSFQYIIAEKKDSSGTGSDGHKHVFTSETTTPPSCTGTGVRTYSCQFCDYSYDEIIPAAGHQWEVTEVKDTEFNDNGDVTAAGYTLYTCAVCAETYKQWSNTGQPGPPTGNTGTGSGGGGSGSGSGSGSSGPSFWDKLKDSVLGLLSDLIDAVFGLITDVLSAVLGLVKDLLSFFFGFLSDTVIKGITDLFSAFGSIKLELPEGVASVFGFFSGVILALPAEIKSLFIFGVAALFLVAIFKMVKA